MKDYRWPCEAYGPRGLEFGAACFVASAPWTRRCANAQVCAKTMTKERRLLFENIQKAAASGDPEWQEIAAEIASPDELLHGELGEL